MSDYESEPLIKRNTSLPLRWKILNLDRMSYQLPPPPPGQGNQHDENIIKK